MVSMFAVFKATLKCPGFFSPASDSFWRALVKQENYLVFNLSAPVMSQHSVVVWEISKHFSSEIRIFLRPMNKMGEFDIFKFYNDEL